MNSRELFLKTMHYGKPERMYIWHWKFGVFDNFGGSQFWQATVDRWYNEGLPTEVNTADKINRYFNTDDYKGYGRIWYGRTEEPEVIEETEEFDILKTGFGREIIKQFKGSKLELSMMHHIAYPMNGPEDLPLFKKMLDADSKWRYQWVDDLLEETVDLEIPTCINAGSLYGWLRNLLGIENISYLLYDNEKFIEELMEYLTEYAIEVIRRTVAGRNCRFDFALFWEDMAGKTGPLISPQHFKRLMVPRYKRITDFLRKELDIDIIGVDSDGNVEKLIPLWLEAGVNLMLPLEVAAGMDVVKLRKEYGKDLLMIGGVDKRELSSTRDRIKREVERVLPVFESGGYIPAVDHSVPPDISFGNYMYYHNLLLEESNKICK
jgi:hypothetical protein